MAALTFTEFRKVLRARYIRAGSYRKLAAELGLPEGSASEILQALKGKEPLPSIVAALGYRKAETRYERVK